MCVYIHGAYVYVDACRVDASYETHDKIVSANRSSSLLTPRYDINFSSFGSNPFGSWQLLHVCLCHQYSGVNLLKCSLCDLNTQLAT